MKTVFHGSTHKDAKALLNQGWILHDEYMQDAFWCSRWEHPDKDFLLVTMDLM